MGQVGGIVRGSTVTAAAGPGGYAQFELSIPSSELSRAMTSLSNAADWLDGSGNGERRGKSPPGTASTGGESGESAVRAGGTPMGVASLRRIRRLTPPTDQQYYAARFHPRHRSLKEVISRLFGVFHPSEGVL